MLNKKNYGINETTRSIIYHKAIVICDRILMRGLKGGDRSFWKGSVHEVKTTVDSSNKNKSLLSSINPFAK